MNDSICDCCDGADEAEGVCADNCEEILAEERARQQKFENDFRVGSQKRKEAIAEFQKQLEEARLSIESKQQEAESIVTDEIDDKIAELKMKYMEERLLTAKTIANSEEIMSMIAPLSENELVLLIIHACQLSGEMEDLEVDDNTCTALRLAALDSGIIFGNENYEEDHASRITVERGADEKLAELMYADATESKVSNDDSGRRRLTEESMDYDAYDNYDGIDYGDYDYSPDYDPEDDYDEYDEYDDVDDSDSPIPPRVPSRHRKTPGEEDEKRKAIIEIVKALPFSSIRTSFVERSRGLLERIELILDDDDSDVEELEDDGDASQSSPPSGSNSGEVSTIDPAALQMVRSRLSAIDHLIQTGFKTGAAARVLLDAAKTTSDSEESFRDELLSLASWTLYHSRIRASHVWQIFQYIVPELNKSILAADEAETCSSPWALSCPPSTAKRNSFNIPSPLLLKAGESVCEEQVEDAMEGLCSESSTTGDLPTVIPNGFNGYHSIIARTDGDSLTSLFGPLFSVKIDHELVQQYDRESRSLKKKRSDLEKEIKLLRKESGMDNPDKYGPDGELFSLKDECISITAGKYIYEVCPYGSAAQKDVGSPNQKGTSLGSWDGMAMDEEGSRTMRWDRGLKCWNGPNRSASVQITCGAATKLISADEPDTCRYVFEMESPIACDEEYQKKHKL